MKTFIDAVVKTAAAVALSLAPAAQAQDQKREAMLKAFEEAQEVPVLTVPFNPPLGVPLNYLVEIERKRPKGDSRMALQQVLTFSSIKGGYLLDLDIVALEAGGARIDLTDPEAMAQLPVSVRPFVTSLELDLDAAGEAVRVRDWERLSAMLGQLPEEVGERVEPEKRDQAIEMARELFAPMISATAEDAAYVLLKGWPSILGYGGLELEADAVYESESEIGGEGGALPEPIDAIVTLELGLTPEGDYRFVQSREPEPAALTAAMAAFLERVQAMTGNANKTDFTLTDMSLVDKIEVVFAQSSGLPTSARITRTTAVNGETVGGEVITITQQSP